jgi:translocation and assembly module TamA
MQSISHNHFSRGTCHGLAVLGLLLVGTGVHAEIEFRVSGVDEALEQNILNHNDVVRLGRSDLLSDADIDEIIDQSEHLARVALRPYGYYHPKIRGSFTRNPDGDPLIELAVRPGPPIKISSVQLALEGPGAGRKELKTWRDNFPLKAGDRLDQVEWEAEKQKVSEIAAASGYLELGFPVHELALDLEQKTAAVKLTVQTGRRFVIGKIDYGEHVLQPGIVEYIPRFETGDPYSARLMDDFRVDLWRTGYFTDVEVIETRNVDVTPPVVDLRVELETTTRNSYQGALGFGTDTGIRLQASWSKRPLSGRGDRLDIGVGWQEYNNEFAIRGNYRLPLRRRTREYWITDATIRFENQDLELKRNDDEENFLTIANGDVKEQHVKFGWLKIFNYRSGEKQMLVTPFAQYLNGQSDFNLIDTDVVPEGLAEDPDLAGLLHNTDNAFSLGVDLDIVAVVGKSFETHGRHDRAWLFASNQAIVSDVDFVQAYLSIRRSFIKGGRWKFLFRGEVGYTDAVVDDFSLDVQGAPLELSVTQLPNFYRFKAGGSASVRGYAFEELSNNNIGSNNIVTASAEIEYRLTEKWSAAAFADIGNAFNDWSDPELKLGVGVGIRWYSIAGPIRLDVAQARDFADQPWRVHLTIGTPLL